jgi:hypothetical protein
VQTDVQNVPLDQTTGMTNLLIQLVSIEVMVPAYFSFNVTTPIGIDITSSTVRWSSPWLSRVLGPSHWGASPRAIGDAKARKNAQKPRPSVVGVKDAVFAIAG